MSHDLRWLAPIPPEPKQDALEVHQFTRQFYQEVQHREAFERYCHWYAATAESHRQEHQKLQNDFNFFGWFCRSR